MSWERAREGRWTVEREGGGEGEGKEEGKEGNELEKSTGRKMDSRKGRSRGRRMEGAEKKESKRNYRRRSRVGRGVERANTKRILHCKSCTKTRLTTGKDCSVHSQTSLTGNKLSLQR